jgi:hypothetical protein
VRFDQKLHLPRAKTLCKGFPLGHGQHDTKVADWNGVPVHCTGLVMTGLGGGEMGDDLVTIEVEVHPVTGGTPLRAAQQVSVEVTGFCQRGDREGEMERVRYWHRSSP